MKNTTIIDKIKKAALADKKKRTDRRYKIAMAFLVKKGLLKTNENFLPYYQAKVTAKDLIWAGKNVEPRILEVLPVAALRLPKAIKIVGLTEDEINLKNVMDDLTHNKTDGRDFLNMPYVKIKAWLNLKLNDGRTKLQNEKKIMRSFRLKPETLKLLEILRKKKGFNSDAALLEYLVSSKAIDDRI
jgi:hypothetical protein